MRTRSPLSGVVIALLCWALVFPPEAAPQSAQKAGEVDRVIPAVKIERGAKHMTAAAHSPVNWEDIVATERMGRARVALDDGSLLNVGSESNLKIVKQDAASQQTQIDLTYGRMRSRAVKISKPGGKFEVRTPAGVAGVVGTDFFLAYLNGLLSLIVFEGTVQFCNLKGDCVMVGGGMASNVRNSNDPPDQPFPATPSMVTEAANSTSVEVVPPPAHAGLAGWQWVGIIGVIAGAAIAIPLSTRGSSVPGQGTQCPPLSAKC